MEAVVARDAAFSVASHVLNFAGAFEGDVEPTSGVLAQLIDASQQNRAFRASTSPVRADSPLVNCLYDTFVGQTAIPPGNYVFFTDRNMGKSAALRLFSTKTMKKRQHRSIYVSGLGAAKTYFENVALNLNVDYNSNWAKCLVAAMTRAPGEKDPLLIFDEFNALGENEVNLNAMDMFMRECVDKHFYLIIVTSSEKIANRLIELNDWGKIKPLQAVHDGNILAYGPKPSPPNWKTIHWTVDQLKGVITKHNPRQDFGSFDFLREGMNPFEALQLASKFLIENDGNRLLPLASDLSIGE